MATKKKTPSLAVGRGEKLPVSKGAGLTAKGRAKYNAATGSNLEAPQPEGGARKRSFCARMSGMPGPTVNWLSATRTFSLQSPIIVVIW